MTNTLASLRARIEETPTLASILAIAKEKLDDDPGHDVEHALRVAHWTTKLAESPVDLRLVVAAALFHDLVNLPKDHPERAYASDRSAAAAAPILRTHGYTEDEITLVCNAIRDHSFSRGATPTTPLGRALQDADRLEALGVLGVFRTFSTGARMGARYFHTDDPWAEKRALDDLAYSVDHFSTKLLKLHRTLCTPLGREEAARRVARMEALLEGLGEELGRPYVRHASL